MEPQGGAGQAHPASGRRKAARGRCEGRVSACLFRLPAQPGASPDLGVSGLQRGQPETKGAWVRRGRKRAASWTGPSGGDCPASAVWRA